MESTNAIEKPSEDIPNVSGERPSECENAFYQPSHFLNNLESHHRVCIRQGIVARMYQYNKHVKLGPGGPHALFMYVGPEFDVLDVQQPFCKRKFHTCIHSHTGRETHNEYLCFIGKKLIDFTLLWWYS